MLHKEGTTYQIKSQNTNYLTSHYLTNSVRERTKCWIYDSKEAVKLSSDLTYFINVLQRELEIFKV